MLFAFWPLPGPDFDTASVGVPTDWPFLLDGFAAHWQKNMNPARPSYRRRIFLRI
jgi:heparan-alpha-glucosaminide N-acetyltransferase